ncbi:hypothetical protein XH97_02820 [Bradyrhizobium sp. CCBAU 53380]|nr:hypothetical protein [Bradyrhizobium sp. CCBAU 53380]
MVEDADLYAGRTQEFYSVIDDPFANNQVSLVNVARFARTAPCRVEASDTYVPIALFDDVGFEEKIG